MGGKRWPWRIHHDRTKCEYAFFVSHVSEDLDDVTAFVQALDSAFQKAGGLAVQTCFIDSRDWELAKPVTDEIRQKLLLSQFFIGWVTPAYLRHSQQRGWVWIELAYATLIENSSRAGPELDSPFILPVFRGVNPEQLSQTPWHDFVPRQVERSSPRERLATYLKRLVPQLLKFHGQQMTKWNRAVR